MITSMTMRCASGSTFNDFDARPGILVSPLYTLPLQRGAVVAMNQVSYRNTVGTGLQADLCQHPAFWGQPMTAEQRFNNHNTFPLPIGASHRAEPVSHTQ